MKNKKYENIMNLFIEHSKELVEISNLRREMGFAGCLEFVETFDNIISIKKEELVNLERELSYSMAVVYIEEQTDSLLEEDESLFSEDPFKDIEFEEGDKV